MACSIAAAETPAIAWFATVVTSVTTDCMPRDVDNMMTMRGPSSESRKRVSDPHRL